MESAHLLVSANLLQSYMFINCYSYVFYKVIYFYVAPENEVLKISRQREFLFI